MGTNETLVCPNCGANITNFRNCEYCGSLLVRFAEKGIDIQKTVYFDNSKVFNSLFNALKLSLKMRKQPSDYVALDVYKAHNPICSVVQAELCVFADDTIIPRDSDEGLSVIFGFDNLKEEELNKFRELDCFPLFIERSCILSTLGMKEKVTEFFIDFGHDAEGAARLLSDIIEKLYGVVTDSELECEVNVGSDNIEKSRIYHVFRRPYLSNKKDVKKNKSGVIMWAILAPICLVVGIVLLTLDAVLFGLIELFIAFIGFIFLFVYRHSILHLFRGVDDNKK